MIDEKIKENFASNRKMLEYLSKNIENNRLADKSALRTSLNNMILSYNEWEKRKILELKQGLRDQEKEKTEEYMEIQKEVASLQKELDSEKSKNARLAKSPERNERALRKSDEVMDRISNLILNQSLKANNLQEELNSLSEDRKYVKEQISHYNKDVQKLAELSKLADSRYDVETLAVDDVMIVDNIGLGREPMIPEKKGIFSKLKGLFTKNKEGKEIRKKVEQDLQREEYSEQINQAFEEGKLAKAEYKEEKLDEYHNSINAVFDKIRAEQRKKEMEEKAKREADFHETNDFDELKELANEAIADVEAEELAKRQENVSDVLDALDSDELKELTNEAIAEEKEEQAKEEKRQAEKVKNAEKRWRAKNHQRFVRKAVMATVAATLLGGGAAKALGDDDTMKQNQAENPVVHEGEYKKVTSPKHFHLADIEKNMEAYLDGKSDATVIDPSMLTDSETVKEPETIVAENPVIEEEKEQTQNPDSYFNEMESNTPDQEDIVVSIPEGESVEMISEEEASNPYVAQWVTSVDEANQALMLGMIKSIADGSSTLTDHISDAWDLVLNYSSEDLVNSLRNALESGNLTQGDMDRFIVGAQKEGWTISFVCFALGISDEYVKIFTGKDADEYRKNEIVQEETTTPPPTVEQESTVVPPIADSEQSKEEQSTPPKTEEKKEEDTEKKEETNKEENKKPEETKEQETESTTGKQESLDTENKGEKEEEETNAPIEEDVKEETPSEEIKTPEQLASEKHAFINDMIQAYEKGEMTAEQVAKAAKENQIQKSDFTQEQIDKAFKVIMQKEGMIGITKIQEMLEKNGINDDFML